MKTAFIILGIVALAAVGYFVFMGQSGKAPTGEVSENADGKMTEDVFGRPIEYTCAEGRGLAIQFGNNAAKLILSDGRAFTLEQTAAEESGVTYGNDTGLSVSLQDASAFVMENGAETFSACRDASVTYPEVSE